MNVIYPYIWVDDKSFSATYKGAKIAFEFVSKPYTKNLDMLINNKQKHIESLQYELFSMKISDTMKSAKIQEKIKLIFDQMAVDICADYPSVFWNRKKHIVTLPYKDNFSENNIPTKFRPCQMNFELVEFCKKEIDNLLQNGLIKPSKLPFVVKNYKYYEQYLGPRLPE